MTDLSSSSDVLSKEELRTLRKRANLTQSEMAVEMGHSFRAYQDIETGVAHLRAIHIAAIERASLRLAIAKRDLNLALPAIRQDALKFSDLVMRG